MKFKCLLVFYFSFVFLANASNPSDSIFVSLDKLLEQKQEFIKKKWQRIESLNQLLKDSERKKELQYQYEICANLFEEYKSFQYDSAFKYTNRMLKLAYAMQDKSKINNAKVNVSFILVSSGMFKESLDSLATIDSLSLPVPERINFYKVFARTYYDLSDYSQDQHYGQVYNHLGNTYLSRALQLSEKGTSDYLFLKGWEYMRERNIEKAISTYEKLLKDYKLSEHAYAIVTSSLSYIYKLDNAPEKSKEYLVKAAMADIRASVLETVALRDLAEILYKENQLDKAYRYIKIANDDAYAYGAKFRKVQIANILPLIESAHVNESEAKRKNLLIYSLFATFIIVTILILFVFIYRNNQKLKLAQEKLSQSHAHLQELNNQLQEINSKLVDANKIKEEYIGHFFKTISEYIDKIDRFKTSIDRKISQKKIDQIQTIVNQINLKAEWEELYGSFDRIFLEIFPDFVSKFNSFLTEDAKYVLEENEPLPPELRIFALIRLGINDNEKIAQFLRYSINTIYTYKTRLKNKTIDPNEKLEVRVMEIKAS